MPHQADRFDSGPRAMEPNTYDNAVTVQLLATFDDDAQGWWLEPADVDDHDQHDPESGQFVIVVPAELWATWREAFAALEQATAATIAAAGLNPTEPHLLHPCARYSEDRREVMIAGRGGLPPLDLGYWPTCSICGHDRDAHDLVVH